MQPGKPMVMEEMDKPRKTHIQSMTGWRRRVSFCGVVLARRSRLQLLMPFPTEDRSDMAKHRTFETSEGVLEIDIGAEFACPFV